MRNVKGCGKKMADLYRLIPSYPREISRQELAKKMQMSSNDIGMMIGRLMSMAPLCEDERKLCYISPEERKKFLNAINMAERRADERKKMQ